MKLAHRIIDHVVYCVPDLDESLEHFRNQYGITPVIGGRHLNKGTKNALVHLGNQCYLEILAIDHENDHVKKDRWMGIDLIDQPMLTRWSLKSSQLNKDQSILKNHNPQMGQIEIGERATSSGDLLQWNMILPLSSPKVELSPFITDWSNSDCHPCDSLEQQCTLLEIAFIHPEANRIQKHFEALDLNLLITPGDEVNISLVIEGPNGLIRL